ncbi:MAG: UbiD family decarboxylase, partial [Dehalococcoidia bacterium]|nr:UbiD family decarboxylase [Dehalococcoidia bacterium]
MPEDLRAWLSKVEQAEGLKRLDGADWDLEMGCLTALNWAKNGPALLFDKINGYQAGFRVLTCSLQTMERIALTLGLPPGHTQREYLPLMRESLARWEQNLGKYAPRVVKKGPVMENVMAGEEIDLFKFPVPKWHEKDGGRYLGTGDAVITRDPDNGEINIGTYRVMVHDKRTVGLYINPGNHGRRHMEKYHSRGQPCPVAISVGHHPLLFAVACRKFPPGTEYQYIGAIRGEPVEVIEEEVTGLPIPTDSEIVVVGWVGPGQTRKEGPFGEYTGYYGDARQSPLVQVERVYFRNNPIILGSPPGRDPADTSLYSSLLGSVLYENRLKRSGLQGIKAVYTHRISGNFFLAVSVTQQYAGHARQVGLQLAAEGVGGRYVIVVDDDIDVTNIQDILWALSTRSNPERSIDIVRHLPSTPLDPALRKPAEAFFTSKAIIDACRPYEWRKDFAEVIE